MLLFFSVILRLDRGIHTCLQSISFILLAFFITPAFSQPVIKTPVNRIISLAPNVTEMLFAAGAGDQVVGVSAFSDYPPAAKKLPVVATSTGLDLERIVNLKPDLVIAWGAGTPQQEIQELKRLNIPVYTTKIDSIPQLAVVLKQLGQLAGRTTQAQKKADQIMTQYESLKKRYAHSAPVSVFYEISQQPLLTLNKKSLVNQMIQNCGGNNIFANTYGKAPEVDLASLLAKQPQAIIISQPEHSRINRKKFWQNHPRLQAVKANHVFTIDSSLIDRAGPRVLSGMNKLCKDLQHVREDLKKTRR